MWTWLLSAMDSLGEEGGIPHPLVIQPQYTTELHTPLPTSSNNTFVPPYMLKNVALNITSDIQSYWLQPVPAWGG